MKIKKCEGPPDAISSNISHFH